MTTRTYSDLRFPAGSFVILSVRYRRSIDVAEDLIPGDAVSGRDDPAQGEVADGERVVSGTEKRFAAALAQGIRLYARDSKATLPPARGGQQSAHNHQFLETHQANHL